MKLPRSLTGLALVKSLCKAWGYIQVHQTGSHVIIQTEDPFHQRIAVPAHKNLRIGTLHSILKSVAKHKGVAVADILEVIA